MNAAKVYVACSLLMVTTNCNTNNDDLDCTESEFCDSSQGADDAGRNTSADTDVHGDTNSNGDVGQDTDLDSEQDRGFRVIGADGEEDYLQGAVVQAFDIDFATVRVRLYDEELSIEYITEDESSGVAFRLTIVKPGEDIETGTAIDLSREGRITREASLGDLPDLLSGELVLNQYENEDGAIIAGTFSGVFKGESETQFNLEGGFSSPLEVVSF